MRASAPAHAYYERITPRLVRDTRTSRPVVLLGYYLSTNGRRLLANVLTTPSLRNPHEIEELP